VAAPDYATPIFGWRGWFVIGVRGSIRLSSLVYHTTWLPSERVVAICRSGERLTNEVLTPQHPAPEMSCLCGIYACESVADAAGFFDSS